MQDGSDEVVVTIVNLCMKYEGAGTLRCLLLVVAITRLPGSNQKVYRSVTIADQRDTTRLGS